ncbi:MAG TPA: PLD nuclease N-terminal domain-containing protein [Phycisphaerae bacterium]|nr:PLD nuclease N-terminal domain-containing protein [Phycisphaerae bacterium]
MLAVMALQLLPCVCMPIGGLIVIAGTIFWIMMIIEIVQREPSEGNDKIIWLLVVIFLHWLGALIYFLVRRPERIRKYGS